MKGLVLASLVAMTTQTSTLAGTWAFDPHLSDHPEQIARLLRLSSGELSPADVPVGAITQGEITRPDRQRYHEPLRAADQRAFDELTTVVQYPPRRLSIDLAGGSIVIDGGQGAPVTLTADGVETHAPGTAPVKRRARWEGPQLVVLYTLEHGGVLTYRYTVAPTTGQLVIRVTFARRRELPSPYEIKLIYNRDLPLR